MTTLQGYPFVVLYALSAAALLLTMGSLYVLVELCFLRKRDMRVALQGLHLVLSLLFAWSLAVVSRLGTNPELALVGLHEMVGHLTLAAACSLLAALAIGEVGMLLRLRVLRRSQITPDSVKEAFDVLPDGACFSTMGGRPLLANAQMDTLAHDAFDNVLVDERVLWERLVAGDVLPGFEVYGTAASDRSGVMLLAPDGRAWEMRLQVLCVEDGMVREVVATDVSEEYRLAEELSRQNGRLAEVNERLRAYGDDLMRLTREEEVLAAKVRVHDGVGRALVALRSYERQDASQRNRNDLLDLWRRVAVLLQTAADDEDAHEDSWELLSQAADAVGARLVLEGELPEDDALRGVAIALVHECLNNAVRHADAHEVRVRIAHEGDSLCMSITNDGLVPAASAAETGGLVDLRRMVEGVRGTMRITWQPRFVLAARFEDGESRDG